MIVLFSLIRSSMQFKTKTKSKQIGKQCHFFHHHFLLIHFSSCCVWCGRFLVFKNRKAKKFRYLKKKLKKNCVENRIWLLLLELTIMPFWYFIANELCSINCCLRLVDLQPIERSLLIVLDFPQLPNRSRRLSWYLVHHRCCCCCHCYRCRRCRCYHC